MDIKKWKTFNLKIICLIFFTLKYNKWVSLMQFIYMYKNMLVYNEKGLNIDNSIIGRIIYSKIIWKYITN